MSVIEDSLKEIYILVEAKLNCHLLLGIILDMMLLISDAKTDTSLCEFLDKIITVCTAPQTNEVCLCILFYCKSIRLTVLITN